MTDKQWVKELRSTNEHFDDVISLCDYVHKHYRHEFTIARAERIFAGAKAETKNEAEWVDGKSVAPLCKMCGVRHWTTVPCN